ncbi:MAG: AmmeMemoRadiSam system protein A [Firmicutes bacterium]|nr:AmmeMemoRadiSam system protein A [Bacillota bacterium]
MGIVFCGTAPHPPIAVPEVGKGRDKEIKDTQEAMLELGRRLKEKDPEVLVFITPHGPVFSDAVAVYTIKKMQGNLGEFGAPEVNFDLENHRLGTSIVEAAGRVGVPVAGVDEDIMSRIGMDSRLDHGVMVPLYFLRKAGVECPVVVISIGLIPYHEIYRVGLAIQQAATDTGVDTAVIASGDLSHRLTSDAPAGYDPGGAAFDREVVRLVGEGDVQGLVILDPKLVESAGECGLRPIIMAMGSLDGLDISPQILSYQGPFGVGYMVADFKPGKLNPGRELTEKLSAAQKEKMCERRAAESSQVRLARETLQKHCRGERLEDIPVPEELLQEKAGAFVSIKKNGQLRGCIGTIEAVRSNLAEEIMENAISAGTRDPRFSPVSTDELDELEYSVDVLGDPEPVTGIDQLDPHVYGVIVRSGMRKGLLLPDLEGIDTAEEQVSIAMQKAGITPEEEIELERFKVVRYL